MMILANDVPGFNLMHPIRWVPQQARSLLDVGCNVGDFLAHCHQTFDHLKLAGVEVNPAAASMAQKRLPAARIHSGGAEKLPFADHEFDTVTCIEVMEHIPTRLRVRVVQEIKRVLRPGGRFVIRVPHAGWTAFLDSNNLRFRLPKVYRAVVGRGRREADLGQVDREVEWHHHFSLHEIDELVGEGLIRQHVRYGGFLLFPLMDYAAWPFYRRQAYDSRALKMIHRLADFDLGLDFGTAAFDVLVIYQKPEALPVSPSN